MTTINQPALKKLSAGTGFILLIPAAMALLSLIISIWFDEGVETKGFLVTAAVTAVPGGILIFLSGNNLSQVKEINLFEAMVLASLAWLINSFAGSIPFIYAAQHAAPEQLSGPLLNFKDYANCLFEATSGFTSTGLSMIERPSQLSHSLQWWRSLLQWVGGIGLIAYISLLLGPEMGGIKGSYEDEKVSKALPTVNINFSKVGWIYLLFTVLSIIIIYAQGISFWESLNHGLTSISTGGFSITDDSLRGYSLSLQVTFFVITIIGALNFNLYSKVINNRNIFSFLKNAQVRWFFILLILGILFLHIDNTIYRGTVDFMESAFQLCSALGTAGFQTASIDLWSPMALIILTFCMLIGGNSSSTTSGIKTFRLIGLLKGTWYFAVSIFFPKGKKLTFNVSEHELNEEESVHIFRHITVFVVLYFLIFLLIFSFLYYMVPDNYTFTDILFETSSTFNNVGLTTGITGAGLTTATKIVMIIAMIIGRIELIPFYVIAFLIQNKKNS